MTGLKNIFFTSKTDAPSSNSLDEERELIGRIRDGDIKAFEQVFKLYHSGMCNYCFKKTGDKEASKEIVQEIFISLYKNRFNWQPKGNIKSYLYKAVMNRAINHNKYNRPIQASEIHVDEIKNGYHSNPEELLIQKEFNDSYRKAVEALPEKCRQIFLLIKESGLTYKEAAEVLELSVKTIEAQMRLAFQKLRQMTEKIF